MTNGESAKTRVFVLVCTIIASGMAFLDGTVVTVALPTLQSTFGATVSQIQWIVDSYALTLAALLLTAGTLSDNFGHKRVFVVGIALFTLGSLLCGIALGADSLIWARAFQGIGAAFMIPGSLAIIYDTFPVDKRGKAIGVWAGFSGGIAAFGPFLGGWLTETWNWRAIFFINLPLGAIALYLTAIYVLPILPKQRRPIDWLGTALITASLFLLAFALIEAPNFDIPHPAIWGPFVAGAIGLALFLWQEARTPHPMLPLWLFRIREVAVANSATFFVYFALTCNIFLVVLNLQQVQGLSPIYAGLGLMPPIVIITFLSWVGGKLTDARGPRFPLLFGTLIVATGILWIAFARPNSSYWTDFFPGLTLFGLGMALVIAPVTKSALAVTEEWAGIASGVNNAVSRIAALFAIAISGTTVALLFRRTLLPNLVSLPKDVQIDILSQLNRLAAIETTADVRPLINEAFTAGYFWSLIGCAAAVLLAFFIVLIFLRKNSSR